MQALTEAEERIMQILWKIRKGFVKDILEAVARGQQARLQHVSTIVAHPGAKGFVGAHGLRQNHEYYPLVAKSDYTRFYFRNFLKGYFGGSFAGLVSFFAKEENMRLDELEDLLKELKKDQPAAE
jgi:predicted transcriptional regulator